MLLKKYVAAGSKSVADKGNNESKESAQPFIRPVIIRRGKYSRMFLIRLGIMLDYVAI